ncbi:hypothetical protein ACRS6P_29585, partial [Pseudomonas aeruginosa]
VLLRLTKPNNLDRPAPQYQLNADIDALGRTLKLVNIALVPSLLTVGVLLGWLWRRRRMARGGH